MTGLIVSSATGRSIVLATGLVCAALVAHPSAAGADPASAKPVPGNRAEMLDALSALKQRSPRLPAPPPQAAASQSPGPLGLVNNALFRSHYLPEELRTPTGRQPDPVLVIDETFAVELFWIVSRVNNCHYCLGHQEVKLAAKGVTEAQLLALDTDWSGIPEGRRAAYEFARKLTNSPQTITAADVDALRPHYDPVSILGIVFLVSRYNSTNRWTDSLGLPQEGHREFTSELAAGDLARPSRVAVGGFTPRGAITDVSAWRAALDRARDRTARLPLADPAAVTAALEAAGDQPPGREYERLLAEFPVAGVPWIRQLRAAERVGELPVELREKIAMVAALADGAVYMQHRGRKRLLARGFEEHTILALGDPQAGTSAEAAALGFARRLTVDPRATTDADIATLLSHYSPRQVAEIVYHVASAAFLDRLTEAAGLGWSNESAP
jgi:alkylhydroperoxidase family enzyme